MKPGFERSKSVPERTLRRISAERKERMFREINCVKANSVNAPELSRARYAPEMVVRRIGSRNLLEELAPLVIPTSLQLQETVDICIPLSPEDVNDVPPQVPPKSPRTESRASPRSKKLPHSANSSTSTTYSIVSPSLAINAVTGRLYTALESSSSLSLSQSPSTEEHEAPMATRAQAPSVESPPSRPKNEYPLPLRSTSTEGPPPAEMIRMCHQRGGPEAPVIDRGRPMKRGDTSLIRSLSKPMLRSPSLSKGHIDIPDGFKATEAPCKVPDAELRHLKKLADEQVEEFKVLPIKQVSKLSKVSPLPRVFAERTTNDYRSCGFSTNVVRSSKTHMLAFAKAGEAYTLGLSHTSDLHEWRFSPTTVSLDKKRRLRNSINQ